MQKVVKPWRKTFASVTLTIITVVSFIMFAVLLREMFFPTPGQPSYGGLVVIVSYMFAALPLVALLIGLNFIYPARWVLYWTISIAIATLIVIGVPMYLENVMDIRVGR